MKIPRFLFLPVLALTLLGASCVRQTPKQTLSTATSTAAASSTKSFDEVVSGMSTQDIADLLNATLQFEGETHADKVVIAQVSFKKALPSRRILEMLNQFHLNAFDSVYYQVGPKGGGWARVLADKTLAQFFQQIYEAELASSIRTKQACSSPTSSSTIECDPTFQKTNSDALRLVQSQGELYLVAIGIKGTQRDLAALQTATPEIFAVKIEEGNFLTGNPLYPETDMKTWF